jgi:threonine dehydrogenase-like Zn-dependent dehydrogenase
MLDDHVDRQYCLGRRGRPDPTLDIIDTLGATYVDSRETPVDEIPEAHEPMDMVLEATGYAKHAFETIDALGANGIGALLGIPDDWDFEVEGGRLHREFVLENKALLGSVNSHVPHFEAAIETLQSYPDWLVEDIITHVYEPEDVDDAFTTGDDRIKVVIEFDSL